MVRNIPLTRVPVRGDTVKRMERMASSAPVFIGSYLLTAFWS